MKNFKDNGFNQRRETAVEAKKALLEKFKTAVVADDPAKLERQAERQAIVAAREARQAEKKAAKEAELKRKAEEAAEREAALEAERKAAEELAAQEAAAKENAEKDRISRVLADEVERKAARDARYAARKARQR